MKKTFFFVSVFVLFSGCLIEDTNKDLRTELSIDENWQGDANKVAIINFDENKVVFVPVSDLNQYGFSDVNNAFYWSGQSLPVLDAGKYLTNNGAVLSWGTPTGGSGTDTNWQTSWSAFDTNMQKYYVDRNRGLAQTINGQKTFTNDTTFTDGTKVYVGNNAAGFGNFSITNGSIATPEGLTFARENSSTGDLIANFPFVITNTVDEYSSIGAPITLSGITVSDTGDKLAVYKTTNATSGGMRALIAATQFTGTTNTSSGIQGINAFSATAPTASGNLTSTTFGGGLRNRYIIQHEGTGIVSQASAVSGIVSGGFTNSGTITNSSTFHAENPSVKSGNTWTNHSGLWIRGGSTSGTITNRYGVLVDSLVGGTNLWSFYATLNPSYFGGDVNVGTKTQIRTDGNIHMTSPAGRTWNCGVTNTGNFQCS